MVGGTVTAGTAIVAAVVLAASMAFLLLAQRRSRATVFTDAAWKGGFLVLVLVYLGYVADNAASFGGDPDVYRLAVYAAHLLVASFFLFFGIYLWRMSRRTAGFVVVTPEFLVALRDRTRAMYGAGPSRVISYAVAKEGAQKAVAAHLGAGLATPAAVWKRLPHLFRLMGYGRLRLVSRKPREEIEVEIEDTFEALHPQEGASCDLTRGYLAGLGAALEPGLECEVEETRCGAGGDRVCRFTVRWFPPMETGRVVEIRAQEAR